MAKKYATESVSVKSSNSNFGAAHLPALCGNSGQALLPGQGAPVISGDGVQAEAPSCHLSPTLGISWGLNDTAGVGAAGPSCRAGSPADYFYRVAVDTLRVGLWGPLCDVEVIERFEALRAGAEAGMPSVVSACGFDFEVKPRGSRWYRYLLVGPELAVEVLPRVQGDTMPSAMVRVGARWWLWHNLDDLRRLLDDLAEWLCLATVRVTVSQLDLRVDLPHVIRADDMPVGAVRGYGARQLRRFSWVFDDSGDDVRVSGFYNKRGSAIHVAFYDKRSEVEEKGLEHYKAAWRAYGIAADVPITRIEFSVSRDWLADESRDFRIDTLDQLTDANIRRLWGYLTGSYLWVSDRPGGRADRAVVAGWWDVVQQCAGDGRGYKPVRVPVQPEPEPDVLLVQAAGCVASAMARHGVSEVSSWAERILTDVRGAALDSMVEKLVEGLNLELDSVLARVFNDDVPEPVTSFRDTVAERVRYRARSFRPLSVPVLSR